MKRVGVIFIFVFVFILGFNANALAVILTEDFEAAFPAWESGWLAVNSNLQNHYVVVGDSVGHGRGNNPDGLWLDDGDAVYGGDVVDIIFNSAFGNNLTSFAIDIAGYVPAQLQIFDKFNSLLLNENITLTSGAFTDPGIYAHYAVTSANGISKFSFLTLSGNQIEGNTSIDNIVINYNDTVVPEPASLALLGLGLLGILGFKRKGGEK